MPSLPIQILILVFGDLWNRKKGETVLVSNRKPCGASQSLQRSTVNYFGGLQCWALWHVADRRLELGKSIATLSLLARYGGILINPENLFSVRLPVAMEFAGGSSSAYMRTGR